MPGSFIFKPIEAHFKDTNIDPYLKLTLGDNKAKSHSVTDKGANPHWNECFTLNRTHEEFCDIHVKDKANVGNKEVGMVKIPLADIEKHGKVCKWFDIGVHGKPIGQLLMEVDFNGSNVEGETTWGQSGQTTTQNKPVGFSGSNLTQGKTSGQSGQPTMTQDKPLGFSGGNVLQEKVPGQIGQSKMTQDKPKGFSGGNVLQEKVPGQTKQSAMTQDRPTGFSGGNLIQEKVPGPSGQSTMTQDKPIGFGESDLAPGKEGSSDLNKPNVKVQGFNENVDINQKKKFNI